MGSKYGYKKRQRRHEPPLSFLFITRGSITGVLNELLIHVHFALRDGHDKLG